jgi:very-short-patch-repair endonuclease
MKEIDIQRLRCPWLRDYSNAAYAAESVVNLIDGEAGFSSPLVRRLFHARSGMTFSNPRNEANIQNENAKLIGSILHKISQRGIPAPCSIKVERYVLNQAKDAGILNFEERIESGKIKFIINDKKIANLDLMVEACCLPELLLDDAEVDPLFNEYKKLCTTPERLFFEELQKRLENKYHDRRAALFMLPQRQMNSMLNFSLETTSLVDPYDIVDFAIEVPSCVRESDTWLRLAVEIDDRSHDNYQEKDKNRKMVLINASWAVQRYLANRRDWHSMDVEIVDEITKCL